ncbi:MAG: lipoprotein signal peptidase [Bacteroides sp.]|nr:lipoprotein signal peptidase [Bacteroides sp.]MCM1378987.1 lipoprotein signal peptidase [Bacteroides sp.]MCM1445603.1 lipoprotein signal peptidase [Prevotella sp.]
MNAKSKKNAWLSAAIILLVLIADQWLKIWVKTTFYLGEEMQILPWFKLLYVQNPGMAFGWSLGNKLALTLFRLIATIFGFWYLCRLLHKRMVSTGLCVCVALILAGAIGNLIDCTFYGLIFNNPAPPAVATLFPASGGYAPLLHGQVVDMLYFPLFHFYWPQWMPWVGGEYFEFFHPIFNLADAAVSCGVIALILFYSSDLSINETEVEKVDKE